MAEDAYSFRPGGSLKLKGKSDDGTKKKKKSKSKASAKDELLQPPPALSSTPAATSSGRGSPAAGASRSDDKKTEAERRFEATQRKRMAEKIKREAGKTHKDRVHEFNAKLEQLSEHHDIPKVGPG